jgi:hypothetical protein
MKFHFVPTYRDILPLAFRPSRARSVRAPQPVERGAQARSAASTRRNG